MSSQLASAGRVLLVDDSPLALAAVGGLLRDHGLEVVAVSSGREVLELAHSGDSFDLFVIDIMMPDMSGLEVTRALRATPRTSHVAILVFTSLDSTEDRVAALDAGADDFLPKSVADEEMLARVRSFISLGQMRAHILSQREAMARFQFNTPVPQGVRPRLIIIHPSPESAELVVRVLREHVPLEFADILTRKPAQGLGSFGAVDVLATTWELAVGDEGLLRRFARQESSPPVLVLDDNETPSRRIQAFDEGADDYLALSRPGVELAARLSGALRRHERHASLRRSRDRAVLAAVTDPLTGLHNRAYFQESLTVEVLRARRYRRPLSLMVLDLDHFKRLNDELGHAAGDQALQIVGARLREVARATDIIARIGGEELAILLPETPYADAMVAAERVRVAVETVQVVGRSGSRNVTVSIGVATCPDNANEPQVLVERADEALYAAKGSGRNQVMGAAVRSDASLVTRRSIAASDLVERLRGLLSEDLESPLASSQAAARLLKEGTAPSDPLFPAVVRLEEAAGEIRQFLAGFLEDLRRYIDQNR